ncbi:MAG: thioredoxin family protein [Candidatus Freyarchaeota archaeon]
MIIIEIFYSKNCPYCPAAKRMVYEVVDSLKENVIINEIDVETRTGQERAQLYHLQGVPTIAINGAVAFVGLPPSKRAIASAIRRFTDGEPIFV